MTVGTRAAFTAQVDDVAVADVDDNGKPDVIAAIAGQPAVQVAHNTTRIPGVSTGDAQPSAYGRHRRRCREPGRQRHDLPDRRTARPRHTATPRLRCPRAVC